MPTTQIISSIKKKIEEEKNRIENSEKNLKKNKGIILGIDLSKAKPGISIINLNSKKVVYIDDYASSTKDDYTRYLEIKYWLEIIIDTFRPEAVMIEKEFIKSTKFGSKGTIPLLKLHGFVYYVIKCYHLPIYEILPSSARAFLKIKPNTKEQAFEYVKTNFEELKLTTFKKDNDKADSIIIGLNFLNENKKEI